MSQEFRSHPLLSNYEASRDGIVRHRILKNTLKKMYNTTGYLMFTAGGKKYYIHRIIYEAFNGLIEDGLVIDHKNNNKNDNSLSNLRAVTQSQNAKFGGTGKYGKQPRGVKSFDTITHEKEIFQLLLQYISIFVHPQYKK